MLTLSARASEKFLGWYINMAFGVHLDYKGYSRGIMKFWGKNGAPMQKSIKQQLKTSSSIMCELVGVDDLLPKVMRMP